MTKQVNSSKQASHTFPESIRKSFEELFCKPIASANYCGDLAVEDGGVILHLPTFVVNGTHYVYVHNATKGTYQCETIISRQERQRKFGEQVHRLMDEYGFTWELGKVILQAYPIESSMRMNLCMRIQEAKKDISTYNVSGWKEQFANNPKEVTLEVLNWYSLRHWLNTRNHQVYNALQNYLFANN